MKRSQLAVATVTVSSKGQFSVPKHIRDGLGLRCGSRVELTSLPEGFAVRVRRRASIAEAAGSQKRRTQPKEGGSA
jgi:AbrB family looped-hinge helix DNA binding protein